VPAASASSRGLATEGSLRCEQTLPPAHDRVKMADRDRWPMWAAEQAGTNDGPSIGSTLLLFAMVALVLLALLTSPTTTPAERHKPTTTTEVHRGR
jgi:hypothetical protein